MKPSNDLTRHRIQLSQNVIVSFDAGFDPQPIFGTDYTTASQGSDEMDLTTTGLYESFLAGDAGLSARSIIYTDRGEQPSLQELLEQHRVLSAVIESETVVVKDLLSPWRVAFTAAIAASVSAVGWTLLAVGIADAHKPNGYVALLLGLGGLVLLATVMSAIQNRDASA